VWGKPGRGGALASWLIRPPIVNLIAAGYTSYNATNLAIWVPTRTLCALHQSTWLSAQPLTLLEIYHFATVLCNWFSVATDTCNWKLAQLPKTNCRIIAVTSDSPYIRLGYTVSSTHILH
jgi:hypothetical protein